MFTGLIINITVLSGTIKMLRYVTNQRTYKEGQIFMPPWHENNRAITENDRYPYNALTKSA